MFIKKKEYEELWSIINKQNELIEEVIDLVMEANARTMQVQKCCFSLMRFVDTQFDVLPPEAKKIIDEMNDL